MEYLTEYETTVIMRPDITGDAIEEVLEKLRGVIEAGGKLIATNHWGRKRLSFPMKKHERGVYVHFQYLGGSGSVLEFERNMRLSDKVLRFMTIRIAKNVDPTLRDAQDYQRPDYGVPDAAPTARRAKTELLQPPPEVVEEPAAAEAGEAGAESADRAPDEAGAAPASATESEPRPSEEAGAEA